jgi:hypothetical protein
MKNDQESIHARYLTILRESMRPGADDSQSLKEFGGEDVDQVLNRFGFEWNPGENEWQQDEEGFLITIKHDQESGYWSVKEYNPDDDDYYSRGGETIKTWSFRSLDELLDALDAYPVTSYGISIPAPEIKYSVGAPEPDPDRGWDERDY